MKGNMTEKTEERRNRFNNESIMLTKEEAKIHDSIFTNDGSHLVNDECGICGGDGSTCVNEIPGSLLSESNNCHLLLLDFSILLTSIFKLVSILFDKYLHIAFILGTPT